MFVFSRMLMKCFFFQGAAHCQPTGYQSYSNPPYHPIPSPRPHHYANHQMQQQNMPYRHHGGAYAPSQNQYGGQNMSQDMYRNHHSGYVGGGPPNPRNMPNKPWSENAPPQDMMYGHPQQMMNNSPVNTMRSPPHANANMNPAPPPQGQHYRQMQSPAHSPHSWSQAQIPSPMHASRTTPSPLQNTHARSPGHSQQPFSPPAMGMNPPTAMSENGGQPPPAMGGENHNNPSNPLHSLQKMVMLDQDPAKVMMPMMGDGSEQFANQCGFAPEETGSNESKDSAYSTYYNMDENRFESKPNIAANDTSTYSTVQQVSNCNFPLPTNAMNSEEKSPCVGGTSVHEALPVAAHLEPPTAPLSNAVLSATPSPAQCPPAATHNDCPPLSSTTECPPHAELAPVFSDQTEAAVATNSELALVTQSSSAPTIPTDSTSDNNNELPLADIPNPQNPEVPGSSSEEIAPGFESPKALEVLPVVQIKTEDGDGNDKLNNNCQLQSLNEDNDCSAIASCETDNSSINASGSCTTSKSEVHCKKELSDSSEDSQEKILNSETIKLIAEVHKSDMDTESAGSLTNLKEENFQDEVKKPALLTQKTESNCKDSPSDVKESSLPEDITPEDSKTDSKDSPNICDNSSAVEDIYDSKPLKDLARNPVKVVIHRIRKDDTNDTWHVPGSSNKEGCQASNVSDCNDKKQNESKIPNVGPQIIILSPASSSQKKFGFQSSVAANNVITIDEDITIVETIESPHPGTPSSRRGRNSPGTSSSSPDKKRGRPVGSKNKSKPSSSVKKKKGRRGGKKKKLELSKAPETPSKPGKRAKIFNGPYVHIVGSKDSPSSIKVVNVAQKEEEKVNKVQPKRNFSNTANRIKKKPVGHLSTLSPTYDAFNRDKTWLCVFCHKGSHIGGLGDLYGPYYIKDKNPESTKSLSATPSTSSGPGSARGKRRKSEADDTKASKRAKHVRKRVIFIDYLLELCFPLERYCIALF